MISRRRKPLRRVYASPQRNCPLTLDEVLAVLGRQEVPLSTPEVVEYCQALHDYPGMTLDRIRVILTTLERRGRVQSWPGGPEFVPVLTARGLPAAALPSRLRYWAVIDSEGENPS